MGDPKDPKNFLGALNSRPHFEKVRSYIRLALEEGGTIHCGETVDKLHLKEENINASLNLST